MYRSAQENNMNNHHSQSGFTLIETLIAIFILTMTIGGLLTLAANGYFSVRYARNQITANNLLQESLEYVRNNRDTSLQQGGDWNQWVNGLQAAGCMSTNGCTVDAYSTASPIRACGNTCEAMTFYPDNGLYGYADASYPSTVQPIKPPYLTTYTRAITIQENTPDELTVTSTMHWMNGNAKQTLTQSVVITNWHL